MTVYRYVWGNNVKRRTMKGRQCVILAAGAMNTVLVQFLDDGQRETTSRRALRRVRDLQGRNAQAGLEGYLGKVNP